MDADVVSGLLQPATQGRLLAERTFLLKSVASKRPATASGCGGAGPSAASPLLSDAQRHRPRRGSLHPTPRRSQRRLTPFFSSLLAFRKAQAFVLDLAELEGDAVKILPLDKPTSRECGN